MQKHLETIIGICLPSYNESDNIKNLINNILSISKNIIIPDILLVPLLGFDKKRFRLGYGGGYYDRYIDKFENKKKIFTIGLAYSFQCVEKLPVENFDKNLNCIITNKKIYK